MGINVSISPIPSIQNRSEATPDLWNQRFSLVEQNFNNIKTGLSAAIALAYPSTTKDIPNINFYSSIVIKTIGEGFYTIKTDGNVLAQNYEVKELKNNYQDHDLVPLKYIRDNFSGGGGSGGSGGGDFSLSEEKSGDGIGAGGDEYRIAEQPPGKKDPVMFRHGMYVSQPLTAMRSEHSVVTKKYLNQLIKRNDLVNSAWQESGTIQFGGPVFLPEGSRAQSFESRKVKSTGYIDSTEGTVVDHDEVPTFKHVSRAFGLPDSGVAWSKIYTGDFSVPFAFRRPVFFKHPTEGNGNLDLMSVGPYKSDPSRHGVEFHNAPLISSGHNEFQFPNGIESPSLTNDQGVNLSKTVVSAGMIQKLVEWSFKAFGFRILDRDTIIHSTTTHSQVFGESGNQYPSGKMFGFKLPSWLGGHGLCVIRVENCPFGKLADIGVPSGFGEFYWTATAHSSEIVAAGVGMVGNALRFRLAKLYGEKTGTVACTFIGLGK